MKRGLVLILLLSILFVTLSSIVQGVQCPDGLCNPKEDDSASRKYCPQDCEGIDGAVCFSAAECASGLDCLEGACTSSSVAEELKKSAEKAGGAKGKNGALTGKQQPVFSCVASGALTYSDPKYYIGDMSIIVSGDLVTLGGVTFNVYSQTARVQAKSFTIDIASGKVTYVDANLVEQSLVTLDLTRYGLPVAKVVGAGEKTILDAITGGFITGYAFTSAVDAQTLAKVSGGPSLIASERAGGKQGDISSGDARQGEGGAGALGQAGQAIVYTLDATDTDGDGGTDKARFLIGGAVITVETSDGTVSLCETEPTTECFNYQDEDDDGYIDYSGGCDTDSDVVVDYVCGCYDDALAEFTAYGDQDTACATDEMYVCYDVVSEDIQELTCDDLGGTFMYPDASCTALDDPSETGDCVDENNADMCDWCRTTYTETDCDTCLDEHPVDADVYCENTYGEGVTSCASPGDCPDRQICDEEYLACVPVSKAAVQRGLTPCSQPFDCERDELCKNSVCVSQMPGGVLGEFTLDNPFAALAKKGADTGGLLVSKLGGAEAEAEYMKKQIAKLGAEARKLEVRADTGAVSKDTYAKKKSEITVASEKSFSTALSKIEENIKKNPQAQGLKVAQSKLIAASGSKALKDTSAAKQVASQGLRTKIRATSEKATAGAKSFGAACTDDDECRSGSCRNDKCAAPSAAGAKPSVTLTKKAVGESCTRDIECRSATCENDVCARATTTEATAGLGESCTDVDCETGLSCVNDVCRRALSGVGVTTTRKAAIGGSCTDDDGCFSGNCNDAGVCARAGATTEKAGLGESCADADCETGLSCVSDVCRRALTSVGGTTTAKAAIGEACDEDDDCRSGNCGTAGKCALPGAGGFQFAGLTVLEDLPASNLFTFLFYVE